YPAAFIMQSAKLVAAFVMMGVLAGLGYRRQEFFLSKSHGKTWIGFFIVAALLMGFAMLARLQTTTGGGRGAAEALRYLPLALALAAINSFAEEMLYRGALLGPLLREVERDYAILMTAVL